MIQSAATIPPLQSPSKPKSHLDKNPIQEHKVPMFKSENFQMSNCSPSCRTLQDEFDSSWIEILACGQISHSKLPAHQIAAWVLRHFVFVLKMEAVDTLADFHRH